MTISIFRTPLPKRNAQPGGLNFCARTPIGRRKLCNTLWLCWPKSSAAVGGDGGERIELDRSSQIIHGLGDIVAMLKLPATSRLYPREAVTIHPVLRPDGKPWSADSRADVLVLGDSFFNIFSLEGMGWGASAGFVEQLSHALQRPIDAIIRNDAGALATRELLARNLPRSRSFCGKRLVVWEFAVRELATGNWDFVH